MLYLDKDLWSIGFKPLLCRSEIYMQKNDRLQLLKCMATYKNNLTIAIKNVKAFLEDLQRKKIGFILKGSALFTYHLGCGFSWDLDGAFYQDPKKHVKKLINDFLIWSGHKPRTKIQSPPKKWDHQELGNSEFLEKDRIKSYQ